VTPSPFRLQKSQNAIQNNSVANIEAKGLTFSLSGWSSAGSPDKTHIQRIRILMADNIPRFWQEHRRDIVMGVFGVVAGLVAMFLIYHFVLTKPDVDVRNFPNSNVVDVIYLDATWFHKLYVRWSITDWTLTFLAAGTAVSAAIKNTYSSKTAPTTSLSWLDILLIVFAVMTVLASTFDAKLHAGQLADKYRAGDLHLQKAKVDYEASKKDADAIEKLRLAWHEAQDILEAPSLPAIKAPPADNNGNKPPPPQAPSPSNTDKTAFREQRSRNSLRKSGKLFDRFRRTAEGT
jgi:hypothetical protein